MPNEQARAAMRNRLRAVESGEDRDDREPRPLGEYYRALAALEDQKRDLANEISDLMRDAKEDGHDVKTLKEAHRIAKMLPDERDLKFQRLFGYLRDAAGVIVDLGFHVP